MFPARNKPRDDPGSGVLIAYGFHERDADGTFLVFDLGGGTFDVCVMERFGDLLEVRSVAGESQLGGEDFTVALMELALHELGVDPARARGDRKSWGLLLKRAELLKRRLSRWTASELTVPAFDGLLSEPVELPLAVADAEEAWRPLLSRLYGPCRAALRAVGMKPPDQRWESARC